MSNSDEIRENMAMLSGGYIFLCDRLENAPNFLGVPVCLYGGIGRVG